MRRLALPLLVLSLAACGAPEPTSEPEPTEASVEEVAAEAEPTEEPTTAEAEAECEAGPADTPLAQAITAAPLPDGAAVRMVQEVEDLDTGDLDIVIHLCTPAIDDDAYRVAATDLAIAARDTGEEIDEMIVYQYSPEGEQGDTLNVDGFGDYTWDRDAARAPESIWES